MGWQDIDQARMRLAEAREYGMRSQSIHRALAEGKLRGAWRANLRAMESGFLNAIRSFFSRSVTEATSSHFRNAVLLYWSHNILYHPQAKTPDTILTKKISQKVVQHRA